MRKTSIQIVSKFKMCTYFTLSVAKQYDNYAEGLRVSAAKKIQISIFTELVSTVESNSAFSMPGTEGATARRRKEMERNKASNDADANG